MSIMNINNMKLKLYKEEDETNEQYNTRQLFIKKANPKNETELTNIVRLSFIYRNMVTLGCKYTSKLEKQITDYLL